MSEKAKVRITNWNIIPWGSRPKLLRLTGDIENHPRLGKLPDVITSAIVKLDMVNRTCETMNTIYQLVD